MRTRLFFPSCLVGIVSLAMALPAQAAAESFPDKASSYVSDHTGYFVGALVVAILILLLVVSISQRRNKAKAKTGPAKPGGTPPAAPVAVAAAGSVPPAGAATTEMPSLAPAAPQDAADRRGPLATASRSARESEGPAHSHSRGTACQARRAAPRAPGGSAAPQGRAGKPSHRLVALSLLPAGAALAVALEARRVELLELRCAVTDPLAHIDLSAAVSRTRSQAQGAHR